MAAGGCIEAYFLLSWCTQDVDLDAPCISSAASEALQSSTLPTHDTLALDGQMHQLHSALGRLQGHLNELAAYTRYHGRLTQRLEQMQHKPEEFRDELIPAYVVDLLAGPGTRLADQVRVLSQRFVAALLTHSSILTTDLACLAASRWPRTKLFSTSGSMG
jgi:hypothetical protein